MIRLRMRSAQRPDSGIAMIFVIGIGLVVTLLVTAMLVSVLQDQRTTRAQRNITSAQGAAEAGLNDAIFQLGQYDSSGNSEWDDLSAGSTAWTKSNPNTQTFGNASYQVWITTDSANSAYLIVWSKGTYGSNTRTIRAVVEQQSPPAFDYSMFASTGVDIHHHNSSWLSPTVWTTSVHSNGYINIDYSADFTVNTLEAVGAITMQKGGGSDPGGSIPTTGYSWYDSLNGKCFPGGMSNPGGIAPTQTSPSVVCPNSYSGNATVRGTVQGGSVTIGSRGSVLPVDSSFQTDTGQTINAAAGNVIAQSATINGTKYSTAGTYTSTSTPVSCAQCSQGDAASGGQIGGSLTIQSSDPVQTVAYPSINYSSTYLPKAEGEQGGTSCTDPSNCHVFSSGSDFLSNITSQTSLFRTINSDGSLGTWSSSSGMPGVIYLQGDYVITSGSLTLNYSTIQSDVEKATGTVGAAPVIIIQGSLIVETGGLTLNSGLVMVGAGNRTDFLTAGTSTTPVTVNTTRLLDSNATGPAVLAAGGQINSTDYDTDSPWTSSSSYEPAKATPIYIRGLVYTGLWNSRTDTSTPENQHWHNFDPKNLMKIYGAQVGSDLHDCNNFSFSYDPLVQKAFGFSGGTVQIVDYQELGQ